MATAILQVRVDDDLKKRVDIRLKRMGLNMSTAVNMLMHQIDLQGRIPFEIVDRPYSLQHAVNDIENGVGLSKAYNSPKELFEELGI